MKLYNQLYSYDKGTNLVCLDSKNQAVASNSNKLKGLAYDPSGNQLEIDQKKLNYNHLGQLISVSWLSSTEYYCYSRNGQRVKKITENYDSSGLITQLKIVLYIGSTEYRSSYQGENLQYDGQKVWEQNNIVSPVTSTIETRIKSGHGQLAKISQDAMKEHPAYVYNLLNHLSNNSAVLTAKAQLKSYQGYYPYGKTANTQGNIKNKQLGFSGQELDSTGLNYYGFRYYNSPTGRWLKPDPSGMKGSGLNLYSFVKGNPLTFRDSKGLNEPLNKLLTAFLSDMGGRRSFEQNHPIVHLLAQNLGNTIPTARTTEDLLYLYDTLVFADPDYLNTSFTSDSVISMVCCSLDNDIFVRLHLPYSNGAYTNRSTQIEQTITSLNLPGFRDKFAFVHAGRGMENLEYLAGGMALAIENPFLFWNRFICKHRIINIVLVPSLFLRVYGNPQSFDNTMELNKQLGVEKAHSLNPKFKYRNTLFNLEDRLKNNNRVALIHVNHPKDIDHETIGKLNGPFRILTSLTNHTVRKAAPLNENVNYNNNNTIKVIKNLNVYVIKKNKVEKAENGTNKHLRFNSINETATAVDINTPSGGNTSVKFIGSNELNEYQMNHLMTYIYHSSPDIDLPELSDAKEDIPSDQDIENVD